MANSFITPQMISREFFGNFYSNLAIAKNLNRNYDEISNKTYDGQKIGPSYRIRDPLSFNVRTGWTYSATDIVETYKTLTIDTPRGVDLDITDAELATTENMDMVKEKYIIPAAKRLAAEVDTICATYMMKYTPNAEAYTSFAVPDSLNKGYLGAIAKIKQALAPANEELNCVINPYMEANIVGGLAGQYNPTQAISEMFEKGQLAKAIGCDWYTSQVLPSLTTGTTSNSDTPIVGTFSSDASSTLPYSSSTASGTWKAGQTITIADLYDVNPQTKQPYKNLKQFVITADATASSDGTGVLLVYPAINFDTTSPTQNCYVAGGSIDGKAITLCALNLNTAVNTAASTTYGCGLIFHKDSFAFGTAPLATFDKGVVESYQVSVDNFNLRYIASYDITNAKLKRRIDIFFGITYLRPEWCAKILHA